MDSIRNDLSERALLSREDTHDRAKWRRIISIGVNINERKIGTDRTKKREKR